MLFDVNKWTVLNKWMFFTEWWEQKSESPFLLWITSWMWYVLTQTICILSYLCFYLIIILQTAYSDLILSHKLSSLGVYQNASSLILDSFLFHGLELKYVFAFRWNLWSPFWVTTQQMTTVRNLSTRRGSYHWCQFLGCPTCPLTSPPLLPAKLWQESANLY